MRAKVRRREAISQLPGTHSTTSLKALEHSSHRVEASLERIQEILHVAAIGCPEHRPAETLSSGRGGIATVGRHEEVVGITEHPAIESVPDERARPVASP